MQLSFCPGEAWRLEKRQTGKREILSVDKGLSVLEGCRGREVAGVGLIQELGILVRKGVLGTPMA